MGGGNTIRLTIMALVLAVAPAPPAQAGESSMPLMAGSGVEPAAPDLPSALAAAAQLGEPVEVADLTTETERHLANADGSVTFEAYAMPRRVESAAGWVPLDTTLGPAGDRIGPVATLLDMSLSAGGDTEVIRLTDGDRQLGLSWPEPLPTPELAGDTATYPDVYPGVDLVVRAEPDSFAQALVVRTRAAALNPDLAQVTWNLASAGLSVEVQPDGSVVAVDETTAEVVFASPRPAMWDSPTPALDTDQGDLGPGQLVTMPVDLAGSQLTVEPDQAMLTSADTTFPVWIDPSFGRGETNWAPVFRERPTAAWPSGSSQPRNYVRVGLLTWEGCESWCGLWRSHFRFSTSALAGEQLIGNPDFRITLDHSGSCSSTPVSLWRTSTIGSGSGATWNSMNGKWLTDFGDRSARANEGACGQPDAPMEWSNSTMRSTLQGAMNAGNSTFTFGLRAQNEGTRDQWKRFNTDARLVATYNVPPLAPDRLLVDADCYLQCDSPAAVRTLRPVLQARVRDPHSAPMDVTFEVRSGSSVVASGTVNSVAHGANARWRPPSNLPQQQLTFRVRAKNAHLTGPWSSNFTFTPDTSAPGAPTVSSTVYKHKDTGDYNGGAGQVAKFTFTAASSDTVEYRYRWLGGAETSVGVDAGDSRTLGLAPPGDLEQVLEVRALDAAGNTSTHRVYAFLVRPLPIDVAYWKFDDGAGAVAAPATGDGVYTGVLHDDAAWVASGINPDDPAASGTAVSLDGASDRVEMPQVLATNHAAGFSVTAWVNPSELTRYHAVFAQNGQNTTMFEVYYKPEVSQWCLRVTGSDDPVGDRAWACSPLAPQVDEWTHLAAVYDRPAGKVRLFVNGGPNTGEPVPGTVTEAEAPPGEWAATGAFTVGSDINGTYFAGRIDEVRAHQRVLGEFEIQHTFLQCRYAACPPVPPQEQPVLVGAWELNDGTGPVAADSSGMNNHAELRSGAQWTSDGYGGTPAVQFPGDLLTDGPVVLTEQSFTVSAWVRLDQTTTHNQYVVWQSGTDASSLILHYRATTGGWGFSVTSHDGASHHWFAVESTSLAELGEWTHLAGVYDRGSGEIRIYVNGVPEGSRAATTQPSWSGLRIGNAGTGQFYGTADAVRAYQTALTDAQVAALYQEQQGGSL